MTRRAFLDNEVVDSAVVPKDGEVWIADTKLRGFGLRMYMTSRGPVKVFCIRTTNAEGRSVRKTFDLALALYDDQSKWKCSRILADDATEFWWSAPIGRYAGVAREWAKDEIRNVKGLPTVSSQDAARALQAKQIVGNITLERAVQAVLSNYRRMKLSTTYVDKLDKLVANQVAQSIRLKPMAEISAMEAEDIHRQINRQPGNRRTVLPFLGRVFQTFQDLAGGRNEFAIAKDALRRRALTHSPKFEVDNDDIEKVRRLIAILEEEETNWQQALCLRLYLDMHAPLARLLAARWDQFYEVTYSASKQKRVSWQYSKSRFGQEYFAGKMEELLQQLFEKCELQFGSTVYLFPSRFGRKVSHIRSIDGVWNKSLHEVGLPHVSPKQLRHALQESGAWRLLDDARQPPWYFTADNFDDRS